MGGGGGESTKISGRAENREKNSCRDFSIGNIFSRNVPALILHEFLCYIANGNLKVLRKMLICS